MLSLELPARQLVDIWHVLCRQCPEVCGAPAVHRGPEGNTWNETTPSTGDRTSCILLSKGEHERGQMGPINELQSFSPTVTKSGHFQREWFFKSDR